MQGKTLSQQQNKVLATKKKLFCSHVLALLQTLTTNLLEPALWDLMAMSSVTVIRDTQDVDVKCAIEATPEIQHTLVDHANQSNRVTATPVEHI